MAEKLTKKDFSILREVEKNARLPLKRMGRAVHLSPEAVAYRLRRMEKSGHIVCYHALVNYVKVGLFKYKLYLRLKAPRPKIVEQICQYFRRNPKTEWVAHCSGRWDVMVTFILANINEFTDEIEKFMELYAEHVLQRAVAQTLYLAYQPRASIVPTGGAPRIVYYTSADKPRQIDGLDRRILQAVANNGRLPIKQLAKTIKSTPRRVAYRLERLEKEEVILGYKVHLDPGKFDRTLYKIILYLKSINKERRREFMQFCGQLPNVVWPQQVLGAWDFEVDLDVPDNESLYGVLSKLYERFPDVVLNHEESAQIKEYKMALFPGAYPVIGKGEG